MKFTVEDNEFTDFATAHQFAAAQAEREQRTVLLTLKNGGLIHVYPTVELDTIHY